MVIWRLRADFLVLCHQVCSFFLFLFLPNQNCLRRRDVGLLNQLQELDKQISDLRLDVEKTSEEQLETDSRPSSGECVSVQGQDSALRSSTLAPVLNIPRPADWQWSLFLERIKKQIAVYLHERKLNLTTKFLIKRLIWSPLSLKIKASIQISGRAVFLWNLRKSELG